MSKLITTSLKYNYIPVTFSPRSYLLTLLVSPASLALEMAVLYISKRSRRRDSSPVAPLRAGGCTGWEVMAPLGASGVTAGGVGAGVSSSSSSKTSFSSAYTQNYQYYTLSAACSEIKANSVEFSYQQIFIIQVIIINVIIIQVFHTQCCHLLNFSHSNRSCTLTNTLWTTLNHITSNQWISILEKTEKQKCFELFLRF